MSKSVESGVSVAHVARTAQRIRALAATVTLLASAFASAASFDYADTPVGSSDLSPHHFVLDATGLWVHGLADARYASDGTLVSLAKGDVLDALMAGTIDGGYVLGTLPSRNPQYINVCQLTKRGQWSLAVDYTAQCDALASDGSGILWVTTRATIDADAVSVYAVGTDGVGLIGPIALPDHFVALSLAASKTSGAYVVGYDSAASHPAVVALDANGALRWQTVDASGSGEFTQVAVDATGNVRVLGEAADHTLVAAGFDAMGHAIAVTRAAIAGADRTSGIAIASDGSTFNYAPSLDGAHRVLQRIDPDEVPTGEIAISTGVGSYSSQVDGHAGIRIAPNGDVLVLSDRGDATTPANEILLIRFNASGFAISSTPIDADADADAVYVSSMATLADSSALLTVYSGGLPTDPSMLVASPGRFVRVDTGGDTVASPFATVNVVPAYSSSATALIADDGTTYLETTNAFGAIDPATFDFTGHTVSLSAISPAGILRWKLTPGVGGVLAANDDRVCVLGSNDTATIVECRNTDDGSVVSTTNVQPIPSTPEGLHFADDDTLVAVYATLDSNGGTGNGVQVSTIDASGQLLSTNNVHVDVSLFAACDDGAFALVGGADDTTVTRIAPNGSVDWTEGLGTPDSNPFGAQCLDDGSVAVEGAVGDSTFGVSLFSASGSVVWSKALVTGVAAASVGFQSATADSTSLYITSIDSAPGTLGSPAAKATVTRIDRGSGAIEWTIDLPAESQNGVVIDPATEVPIYYATRDTRVTVQALDPDSGTPRTTTVRSCDCESPLPLVTARVTDDGTLIYVLGALGNGFVEVPHVVGIDDVAMAPPQTDIQPSQSGIWYAPYASGQGFGIDISSLDTIFMSWFTYAPASSSSDAPVGNNPAALNWYSLQGFVSPNDAGSSLLTIYSNTGGAFASGSTTPAIVGNATLTYADCGHAVLSYSFGAGADSPSGLSGTIDLVRLTAQVGGCTNADGSVVTGIADASAGGFDTNQSGAWYDAATSGQGLELSIVPPANGVAGLLFGAWFIYDPAGAADDATTQHWFTLQADLSTAANGSVVVPIYSTLGGTLDETPGRTTIRVGQGTLTFDGCASGTFAYQFDATEMAGAYRGLSGTLNLAPLTACQQ